MERAVQQPGIGGARESSWQLAAAKSHVIRRLEESLPATVFAEERKMVEQGAAAYGPLTRIGNAMPALFAVLYIGITWYCQSYWGV